MTSITRYVGGPGTGKTTSLLQFIKREQEQNDVSLNQLYFLSFTKTQRDDVRNRIAEIYSHSNKKDIEKQVRTIHGAALSELMKQGHIPPRSNGYNPILREGSNREPYIDFAQEHALKYYSRRTPSEDNEIPQKYTGNIFYNINRYIQQQYTWTPEDWIWVRERTGETLPAGINVPDLITAWAKYKSDHGYWEDDDYINLAIETGVVPSVDVLVIDEFQDLSPAQYMLYKSWRDSGEISRIYIAGDPNQAIYGFRGADPGFLSKTAAADRGAWSPGEIPQSHRCPIEIMDVADRVLGSRSNMTPKDAHGRVSIFAPRSADDFVHSIESVHKMYGRVLILCRYRHYIPDMSEALSEAGIPNTGFTPGRVWGWETVYSEDNSKVNMRQVFLTAYAIKTYFETGQPQTIPGVVAQDFAALFGIEIPPISIHKGQIAMPVFVSTLPCSDLSDLIPQLKIAPTPDGRDPRRYLNTAMGRTHLIKPGEVIIDTIHAAKGLEAPAVVLHSGYLKKREIDYIRSPRIQDEEKRVYYVGCTRASDALFIMDGLKGNHPAAPPLKEARII